MKHIRFFLVVLVLFVGTQSIAQNYQKQYLSAKSFYSEGEYKLAIEAFRPLAKRSSDNPFAAYASYYYGMSNYYAGFKEEARTVFLQTKSQFPNWSRIDEVNYWLTKLYFENSDHFLALNIAETVRDPQVKANIDEMTVHYLMADTDVEEMEAIFDKHTNKATGSVYAAKLSQEPLDARGRKKLDQLIKQYDLDPEQFLASVKSTQLKESYKVAVMMPFLVETIKPGDKNRVNEFVLDLYNGMKMGFDDLREKGIEIEVFAYDTERDTTATRKLLALDELKGMDMIIGPLFSGPSKIVSEFGLQYGINVINPLSNSPQNMEGNPHYFLLQPSAVTIGEAMADFSSQYYAEKPGIVLFGESDNDIQMARAYAIRFEEQTGIKLLSRGVGNEDTQEILQLLLSTTSIKEATTEEGRENMRIGQDSLGHIFVASSNSLIFSKVVSAIETRGDEIQIIGSADWIDMPVVKYETFERLKVQFYAPGYVNQLTPEYRSFQANYMRKHKDVPSKFADRGYEMALFLGGSLAEYGSYPQLAWESEGRLPGTFTPGYFYPNKQDNQVVPVLEFGDDGLEILVRENTDLKAENDN